VARRKFGFASLIAGAAALAALLVPAGASAGVLTASAPNCDDQSLSQPFTPWMDPSQYVLDSGGDFESAGGWALAGGAAVVDGNEPYYVTSSSDSHSLKLPAGSSATSSTICVGLEHPTLRFFAKRTAGGPFANLSVDVLFEDSAGNVHSLQIGATGGGAGWQPTPAYVVVANLLPLLPGDYTPVQFRFTANGGTFQIDDTYVDPWGRN